MANGAHIEVRDTDNSHIGILEVTDSQNFPLAITYTIASIINITPRSGAWSKTFDIPSTEENNKVLLRIFDANLIDPAENPLVEKPCLVVADGVPALRGLLRIKAVEGYRYPVQYECEIRGDNVVWVQEMKQTSIRDLDWGSITLNIANIETTWTDYEANNTDVVFPVISYGDMSGFDGSDKFVALQDLRPALRIKAILEQAFNAAGFTMVSDFFDGNNAKLDGRRLTLPFVGEGWTIGATAKDDAEFVADVVTSPGTQMFNFVNNRPSGMPANFKPGDQITAHDLQKGVFDNEIKASANYDDTTGIYTGLTGLVRFEASGTATTQQVGVFAKTVRAAIIKEDAGGNLFAMTNPSSITSNQPGTFSLVLSSPYFQVSASDKVYVGFWVQSHNPADGDGAALNIDVTLNQGAQFINDVSFAVVSGQTVAIAGTLPDLKVMDIIAGLKHAFNLYFFTDLNDRKVYVEPGDDFFDPVTSAEDWTAKMDVGSLRLEFVVDHAREQLFEYAEDSADRHLAAVHAWAKDFFNRPDYKYGSGLVTLSDKFSEGTEEVLNPFFAPTDFMVDDDTHYIEGTAGIHDDKFPSVARMWNEAGNADAQPAQTHDFAPRILYYQHIQNGGGWRWDDGAGSFTVETLMPTVHFGVDRYALENGFAQLEFKDGEDDSGNVVAGLLSNFYQLTMNTIERGRTLIADFDITPQDIARLDFRRLIYLGGPAEVQGYWILEEVQDYKPASAPAQLTRCRMQKWEPYPPVEIGAALPQAQTLFPLHQRTSGPIQAGVSNTGAVQFRNAPSYNFGSKNVVNANAGNVASGHGLVSQGQKQAVTGRYNQPDANTIVQVGVGPDADRRHSVLSVRNNGIIDNYGGELYTPLDAADDGSPQISMLTEDEDGELRQMYLDDNPTAPDP